MGSGLGSRVQGLRPRDLFCNGCDQNRTQDPSRSTPFRILALTLTLNLIDNRLGSGYPNRSHRSSRSFTEVTQSNPNRLRTNSALSPTVASSNASLLFYSIVLSLFCSTILFSSAQQYDYTIVPLSPAEHVTFPITVFPARLFELTIQTDVATGIFSKHYPRLRV